MHGENVLLQRGVLAEELGAGRVCDAAELLFSVVGGPVAAETCPRREALVAARPVAGVVAHVAVCGLDVSAEMGVAEEGLVAVAVGAGEWAFVRVGALVLGQAAWSDEGF